MYTNEFFVVSMLLHSSSLASALLLLSIQCDALMFPRFTLSLSAIYPGSIMERRRII